MSVELTAKLFDILEAQAPFRLKVPISLGGPPDISIRTQPDGRHFLRFVYSSSSVRIVGSMVHAVPESAAILGEPAATTVLTRPWIPMAFYFRAMFGTDAPAFLLYRCSPGVVPPDGVLEPGAALGSVTTELEVAFVTEDPGGAHRYLDPAIVIRTFALFSDGFEVFTDSFLELLALGLGQDPSGNFGLSRYITYMEAPALPPYRRRLLEDALRAEYELRQAYGMPPSATADAIYRLFLPRFTGVTRASVVSAFEVDVDAAADKVAYFYMEDLNLHFVALRADQYKMDLIDLRDSGASFTQLDFGNNNIYKVIVSSPVFSLEVCNKPWAPVRVVNYARACANNLNGVIYKGLTKGLLVFRGGTEPSDCPTDDDKPATWRFHFAQGVAGAYELHVGPIPVGHGYACAVEPVFGVFRNGLRIGNGHEIDQLGSDGMPRQEPDSLFGVGGIVPTKNGIPIIGRCQRAGIEYLFVLCREDYWFEPFVMTAWEDIVTFLRDINVVDAFAVDADDSVGLIIDGKGSILKPGCKKESVMPLAIGFRKV